MLERRTVDAACGWGANNLHHGDQDVERLHPRRTQSTWASLWRYKQGYRSFAKPEGGILSTHRKLHRKRSSGLSCAESRGSHQFRGIVQSIGSFDGFTHLTSCAYGCRRADNPMNWWKKPASTVRNTGRWTRSLGKDVTRSPEDFVRFSICSFLLTLIRVSSTMSPYSRQLNGWRHTLNHRQSCCVFASSVLACGQES